MAGPRHGRYCLGLRQFIQQGLGIFGGAIADRFGAKPMIVTGMLMRAAGFATMGIAHEPWLLWFSCLLSGLGGTLFDPPRSALVVKLIRPQQRGRFFLAVDDAGQCRCGHWRIVGELAVAIRLSPGLRHRGSFVCAVCGVQCVVVTGMETLHRTHARSRRHDPRDARQAFCHLCPDAGGLLHAAVQVMLMLPIMVNDVAGAPSAVKWMYAIEACLSLTLLYPIARWSEKHFRLEHRLMAGLLIMSLSMMPVGMVSGLQQLFTLICLFYIGSIIAEPARETLSASLADARARGSYMGFSRLGLAIGGAIGYIGAAGCLTWQIGAPAELPWMMLGIIGILHFPCAGLAV